MTSDSANPEIQSIQAQIDELKRVIQDGLKTPRTKVDPEQLKLAAISVPAMVGQYNIPSSEEVKRLQKDYETLQKQVQKLEYQLSHVLRACSEKDAALSKR